MNFNEEVNRKNTHSVKWDGHKVFKVEEDAFPMWVADMDFKTDPKIIDALKQEAQFGIFGYALPKKSYKQAIVGWMHRRFDWEIDPEWIVDTPGVVSAMHAAIVSLTEPRDSVMISQPVYHPFRKGILQLKRRVVNLPLKLDEDALTYSLDFEAFERTIVEKEVKLYILCSPHNPVGKVWTLQELTNLAEICLKHHVYIFSDEIHMDIVHSGGKHIPIARIDVRYHPIIMTAIAASKTFNLAGLKLSQVIIPDEKLRKTFCKPYQELSISPGNTFAYLASEMAYTSGDHYVSELVQYLEGTIELIDEYLFKHLPNIRRIHSQSLYLVWLDFRALPMDEKQLQTWMRQEAKLWLNDGFVFGEEGKGFQRMNIATPRTNVLYALEQLKQAIEKLND